MITRHFLAGTALIWTKRFATASLTAIVKQLNGSVSRYASIRERPPS